MSGYRRAGLLFALVLLAAARPAQTQDLITPEQAIAAVRQFWNAPDCPLNVEEMHYTGDFVDGWCYELKADSGEYAGRYTVRATDGTLVSGTVHTPDGSGPYAIDIPTGEGIAKQFLRDHFPAFFNSQWKREDDYYVLSGHGLLYQWQRILNDQGVRSFYWVQVTVDGWTGKIQDFDVPTDWPVTIPLTPQISLQQAIQIATPFAFLDPTTVPFNDNWLEVEQDVVGVQRLVWQLCQVPDPVNQTDYRYGLSVDANTGDVWPFLVPLGGTAGPPKANQNRRPVPGRRIIVRPPTGPTYGSFVPPKMEKGAVWVRAELLRAFGGHVKLEPKGVTLMSGSRCVAGRDVGARFEEYGWWVPLRKAVEALGWRLEWVPRTHSAIVYSPPRQDPPRRFAR